MALAVIHVHLESHADIYVQML